MSVSNLFTPCAQVLCEKNEGEEMVRSSGSGDHLNRLRTFCICYKNYEQASAGMKKVVGQLHKKDFLAEQQIIEDFDSKNTELNDAIDALAKCDAPCLPLLDRKAKAIDADGDWNEHGKYVAGDISRLAGEAPFCDMGKCQI